VIVPKYGTILDEYQAPIYPKGVNNSYLRNMFGYTETPCDLQAGVSTGAFGPFVDESPLSDADIRAAMMSGAFVGLGERYQVLEEVQCWRGHVRADYVCISANALSIIEIKSDRDTLRRFDEQLRVYNSVADRVTLVVGWNLAAHALRAAPWWWDVILVERERTSDVRFIPLRDGAPNLGVSTAALVAMLPTEEVNRLACTAKESFRRLRGPTLRHAVANYLSHDELRIAVREWLERLSQRRNGIAS